MIVLAIAAEAANGAQLLELIWHRDFDVVLLNLSMPEMDGLDVLKQLKIEKPRLPVIILTIHPESQYTLRILKAGASGYLTKASADEELILAIRKVNRGGKHISPTLAEKIAFALVEDTGKMLHETLSDREYQVSCLIAAGNIPDCRRPGVERKDGEHLPDPGFGKNAYGEQRRIDPLRHTERPGGLRCPILRTLHLWEVQLTPCPN